MNKILHAGFAWDSIQNDFFLFYHVCSIRQEQMLKVLQQKMKLPAFLQFVKEQHYEAIKKQMSANKFLYAEKNCTNGLSTTLNEYWWRPSYW